MQEICQEISPKIQPYPYLPLLRLPAPDTRTCKVATLSFRLLPVKTRGIRSRPPLLRGTEYPHSPVVPVNGSRGMRYRIPYSVLRMTV